MKYLVLIALLGCVELSCSESTKNLKEEVYTTLLNAPVIAPDFITKLENECADASKQEWLDILTTIGALTENRSGILFPAFSKSLDSANKAKDLAATQPNKKRDETLLMKLWLSSIGHPDLLPFIQMGHDNFESNYKTKFDILSHGKKSKAIQKFVEEYDDSPHAELFNELQPKKSHLARNLLFVGILGGIGYLAYKFTTSQKITSKDQASIDTPPHGKTSIAVT